MKKLSKKDEIYILQARRGGMDWTVIYKMFPQYKEYNHFKYALKKLWPINLPPCGMFSRLESLIHLYRNDLLNRAYLHKVLGEKKAIKDYELKCNQCKQWYGIGFTPFLHHSTFKFRSKD